MMKRQAHNSLNEAVLEYFNNYFGGELNEDTSDEDIMQAVYDLINLTEAVLDTCQLDELLGATPKRLRSVAKQRGLQVKKEQDKMVRSLRGGHSRKAINRYQHAAKIARIKQKRAEEGAIKRESGPSKNARKSLDRMVLHTD